MALQAQNPLANPIDAFDRLHMRQGTNIASGEKDDVSFSVSSLFRFYAQGDDTGKVDILGRPIHSKHWAPTDLEGSMVALEVKNLDQWLATHLASDNPEVQAKAQFVAQTMAAYQKALGFILSIEQPHLGNVEVV